MKKKGISQSDIDKKLAPFSNGKDSNGNNIWKKGQDFWEAAAAQKQGVFKGNNAMMLGDGTMANVGFGTDGSVTAKFEEGISRVNDNTDKNLNGIEDQAVVKKAAFNVMSSIFGEETAREIISGWNAFSEIAGGLGVAIGAAGSVGYGYKKLKNQSAKDIPARNATTTADTTTTNPKVAPTNSNIDNPNSSMSNPSNDMDNYNTTNNGTGQKRGPNLTNFATDAQARVSGMKPQHIYYNAYSEN